uniref:Uncharacterized protein n=1 Tax=Manihot esculenta TaxID=3983 RepID=A0A2C9VKK9_MANES
MCLLHWYHCAALTLPMSWPLSPFIVLNLTVALTLQAIELDVDYLSCCLWSPSTIITVAVCFACFFLNLHIFIL